HLTRDQPQFDLFGEPHTHRAGLPARRDLFETFARVTAERFASQYSNFLARRSYQVESRPSVAMALRSFPRPESRRPRSVTRWRWQVDLYVPPPPSIRKIDHNDKEAIASARQFLSARPAEGAKSSRLEVDR